jgi:hypothetical protein
MPSENHAVHLGVGNGGEAGVLEELKHDHQDLLPSQQSGWLWRRLLSLVLIVVAFGLVPLMLFLVSPADARDALVAIAAPCALLVAITLSAAAQIV